MNSFDPGNEEAYHNVDLINMNKRSASECLPHLYEQREQLESLVDAFDTFRNDNKEILEELDLLDQYDELFDSVEANLMLVNEDIEEKEGLIHA